MADITVTPANVRPLPGAQVRGGKLGEAAGVGDFVASKSDNLIWKADANAPVMPGWGVIVAVGSEGALTGAAGDRVSVLWLGPVAGFTGDGATIAYASDTAGKLADAASITTVQVVGTFVEDNVLLVNAGMAEA